MQPQPGADTVIPITQTVDSVQEAEAFLAEHPEVHFIDLLIADMNGIVRGKRIDRSALMKAFERGIALPASVIPQYYLPSLTFFVWTALLLGGAATIFGPVLGAVLYWALMAFLAGVLPQMATEGWLPLTPTNAGNLRFIVVGVALMLLVAFRPQGILGKKKEMTFVK